MTLRKKEKLNKITGHTVNIQKSVVLTISKNKIKKTILLASKRIKYLGVIYSGKTSIKRII